MRFIFILFLSFTCAGFSYAKNSDEQDYRQSLFQAKQGNYNKALGLIAPLSDKYPKPNRFFYDYIAILSWAGKHKDIVAHEQDIVLTRAPRYVLKNLAFAQRQQQSFVKAQQTYQMMVKRFPHSTQVKIGLGLVLIDQKKLEQAKKTLLPIYHQQANNIDLLYALAYLHETEGQLLLTLPLYEKINRLRPSDTATFKKKILTLNKLGASHLAYSKISDASIFTSKELNRIHADMAAHRIRWSNIAPLSEQNRFNETDLSISKIKANIDNTHLQLGEQNPLSLTGQFDLLVALRNRYKMQEVVENYHQLKAKKVLVPPYSKNAVCDALLYLEQPDKAENCYIDVIDKGYNKLGVKIALFYAYLENEKVTQAQQWITQIAAAEPTLLKSVSPKLKTKKLRAPVAKLNANTTPIKIIQALSLAYADDLSSAEKQLKQMQQTAPYNLGLRNALSNVYYWRGWPRKSLQDNKIGLYQEPLHTGLRVAQSRNLLTLKQYPQAESTILQLSQLFPELKDVQQQKEHWDIHNMREFKTSISFSDSSGNTNGSSGLDIESYLFSAPINYNYRAYLHQRHSQADFIEGNGLLNHAGIGLEYRAPNILLTGELHRNGYGDNNVGASLTAEYAFNDRISANLALESLSSDTPLRALNQDIDAKSISEGFQYRWHESRSVGANHRYLNFSDGNKRHSLGGYWSERWYNQYSYKFSTRVDLYTSKNSKNNVIYFNPEQDFSSSIALENEWLSWRNYEDSFHQRLIISPGFYQQKNYSGGATWALQYEHRWSANNRFELIYGARYASNLYDGDNERSWNYYLSLDWKF